MKKYATTFGGAEVTKNSSEYQEAIQLGEFLARQGYIVKCGGYYGLMEAVAEGVNKVGGECIGITNASFDPKLGNQFLTQEYKAKDLFDRLRELIHNSELFVIQKGSLGTLVELSLVWCLRYTKTIHDVEICLIGDCWHPVLDGLKNLNIKPEFFSYVSVYLSVEQFIKEKS